MIVRNSVKCNLCQDEIESVHRHDFKYCKCGRVAVDGGKTYLRRLWSGDGGPGYEDTSINDDEISGVVDFG